MFHKYRKDPFIVNYVINLIKIFFLSTNVAFVKASAHNMLFLLRYKKLKIPRDNREFNRSCLINLTKAIHRICNDRLIVHLNA